MVTQQQEGNKEPWHSGGLTGASVLLVQGSMFVSQSCK